MKTRPLILLVFLIWLAPYAAATTISFTTANVSGDIWQYQYSVTNDSLLGPIDEFTIYFDKNGFSNLNVEASPAAWDSIAIEPDLEIPSDGFFDSLATGSGIAPGATLGGFAVSFQYLGLGTPGSQPFQIVDPSDFNVIDSGLTTPAGVTPPPPSVPEPGSIALMALGLAALARSRARAK
jgi:hypothetical protein